jgi:hypothetical protein
LEADKPLTSNISRPSSPFRHKFTAARAAQPGANGKGKPQRRGTAKSLKNKTKKASPDGILYLDFGLVGFANSLQLVYAPHHRHRVESSRWPRCTLQQFQHYQRRHLPRQDRKLLTLFGPAMPRGWVDSEPSGIAAEL